MAENIFDPNYVFEQMVRAEAENVARMNVLRLARYIGGYKNSLRDWREQRIKRPVPEPAKLVKLELDRANWRTKLTFGPELVCEPKPNPWDLPEPTPPPNQIVVGIELADGIYAAQQGGKVTTVPVGTETTHEGKKLRLTQLGKPGTLTYRLLWVEEGTEV